MKRIKQLRQRVQWDTYASLLYKTGRVKEAIEWEKKVIKDLKSQEQFFFSISILKRIPRRLKENDFKTANIYRTGCDLDRHNYAKKRSVDSFYLIRKLIAGIAIIVIIHYDYN